MANLDPQNGIDDIDHSRWIAMRRRVLSQESTVHICDEETTRRLQNITEMTTALTDQYKIVST